MPNASDLLLPIADMEGVMALFIPILAIMIPIIVVLLNHQRRMAEIIHQSSNNRVPNEELAGIREELRHLRTLMNDHTIALDDLKSKQQQAPAAEVRERLGGSS